MQPTSLALAPDHADLSGRPAGGALAAPFHALLRTFENVRASLARWRAERLLDGLDDRFRRDIGLDPLETCQGRRGPERAHAPDAP